MTMLVAFGGYDTRKPRVRLLIDALRRARALDEEILIPAWQDVAQTNVPSRLNILKVLGRIALGYPRALSKLFRSDKRAAILLPYPGIVEIFVIAPIARLMRRKLVLDAFLPIHDTIAGDRGLVGRGIVARAIWWFEKFALGLADIVIADTDQHGDYFASEFGLPRDRIVTVLVGAEQQFTRAEMGDDAQDLLGSDDGRPIVLFYGQLIPLHGVPTILDAAERHAGRGARWVIIGKGQLEPMLRERLASGRLDHVEWIEWVEYERLSAVIARAEICLGVFGGSDKASRVIPNKLFQQIAMGKPVITRASPAVDALALRYPASVRTVPAEDGEALYEAVQLALSGERALSPPPGAAIAELTPDAGVRDLIAALDRLG